jgi:hypothetical protein
VASFYEWLELDDFWGPAGLLALLVIACVFAYAWWKETR